MDPVCFEGVEALYIGDTLDDIQAAKEAGLKMGIILAGESPTEDFLAAKPDCFITDFEALLGSFRGGLS